MCTGPSSAADLESRSKACAQAACGRPHHRRSVRVFLTPVAPFAFCHRSEAHNSAVFSQCAEKTKVPIAVLAKVPTPTGAKGTGEGTHRRRCGDETTESQLGLSPDCPADRLGLRHRDRHGRGSPYSEYSLPPALKLTGSVLA